VKTLYSIIKNPLPYYQNTFTFPGSNIVINKEKNIPVKFFFISFQDWERELSSSHCDDKIHQVLARLEVCRGDAPGGSRAGKGVSPPEILFMR
jgi:hypothetical protein